jgi:hypothetical protein
MEEQAALLGFMKKILPTAGKTFLQFDFVCTTRWWSRPADVFSVFR